MPLPQRAESLITAARRAGIAIVADGAEVSDAGLDFFAVFARDDKGVAWVLRAPRREDVVSRAAAEAKKLALVKPHLPVAVPDWQVHTPDLIAYPKLPGDTIADVDPVAKAYKWKLDPQALPDQFVDSMAAALVALHGIDHAAVRRSGMPVLDVAGVKAALKRDMDRIKREIGVGDAVWDRWQRWLADDSLWPTHTTVIHGDLHAGHMLVDTQSRLVGLLDWTEAEVNDPAVDFTGYKMMFGDEALAKFVAAYERAGGRVWPRLLDQVREHMDAYGIKIGLFALLSGQDEYLEMAKDALGLATTEGPTAE